MVVVVSEDVGEVEREGELKVESDNDVILLEYYMSQQST